MPKFAANLSMLFTEVPFLDRFALAKAAGFEAVEYLFPYDVPAREIRARLDKHDLAQALFNMPPGDWEAGERGIASLPDRVEEFRAGVGTALEYAKALRCPTIHAMAGIPTDRDDPACVDTYVANLRYAGDQAAQSGRVVCIEPINGYDIPGYFLRSVAQALPLLTRIGRDNVRLQLDLYHAQLTDGDITHLIRRTIDRVGHVQLASVPERHEPDTGELSYPYVLAELDKAGYDGWVGCEYHPAGGTAAGLGWLAEYR